MRGKDEVAVSLSSYRMAVVVEMNNVGYWQGEGVECDRSIAQYFRMAEEYPDVEIVFVTDRPIPWSKPQPPNLRFLDAPSGDYFAMKRHGMLRARSDLIAFMDSDCIYPRNYVPRLLEAFEDPEIQIVGAKVRYPLTSARLKAGSIRDWGHLPDQGPTLCHFAGSAFAARRQILERHDFGLGFQRVGAEVVLCVLAKMDGVGIRYLPDLTVFHEDYYRSFRTVLTWMFRRLAMTAETLRLYMQVRGPLALSRRILLRLAPLMTAAHISWTCVRRYPLMRAGLAVRGWERLTVPLWLAAYSALGFVIALRMVLQPGWLRRTAIEQRSTFSPEVFEDRNHPLNLRLDRVAAWLWEDPSRGRQLFLAEGRPASGRADGVTVSPPEVARDPGSSEAGR